MSVENERSAKIKTVLVILKETKVLKGVTFDSNNENLNVVTIQIN
jgi:hypothetical protein